MVKVLCGLELELVVDMYGWMKGGGDGDGDGDGLVGREYLDEGCWDG